MKVEVLGHMASTLPPDDDHPYRSGPWRPQVTERRAWDLDVKGDVPDDLAGVYLRNTENPLHPAIDTYHPFDGDGMVHSLSFVDGEALYHNRFVRTEGLLAEQEAMESLWAGVAEPRRLAKRDDGWGNRGQMKDASSTDVIVHHGMALTSFYQCGDLYRLDPVTLEDRGRESVDGAWGGRFPAEGVSAHAKVDQHARRMMFFNYSTTFPYMHYGELAEDGKLAHYVDVELPGPRLPHDMAYTANYAILNDCPLFYDPDGLRNDRYFVRFFDDMATRFAIVPRSDGVAAGQPIRWFEAEPTFVLHWINAYEDGDDIVLDGFFEHNPSPKPLPHLTPQENAFRYLDLHVMKSEARRWRFDLTTGTTTEEPLSDRIMEFAMINGRYGGRPYRYSYNALPCEGWFGFRGFVKHDVETGTEEVVELPDGVFCSEAVMAPRQGADASSAEDDGYVLTYTTNMNDNTSSCLIYPAADPLSGPLAEVSLPERISSGTHATWASADQLSRPLPTRD